GIVVLEAMAAGTPVVAAAVGGVPEVVVDGANGLSITGGEATCLAGAIGRVLDDPVLGERLVSAGLDTAALHDWPRSTTAYSVAYDALTTRSSSPHFLGTTW
ncbi:MAG: glycosyltransferase family 4 protein, partial [Solirubrobacterales bacterium]|nr:glycosyltransferase family 4 protein [Solirubrobacterales bacterium]